MSPIASVLLLLSSLTLLSIASGQGRAPHGIAYENPMAFSPSAYEFFHPNVNPCAASNCLPLPVAAAQAHVQDFKARESTKVSTGRGLGAGGIVGVTFGLGFAVLITMGVYYVLATRRANANRANSVQYA